MLVLGLPRRCSKDAETAKTASRTCPVQTHTDSTPLSSRCDKSPLKIQTDTQELYKLCWSGSRLAVVPKFVTRTSAISRCITSSASPSVRESSRQTKIMNPRVLWELHYGVPKAREPPQSGPNGRIAKLERLNAYPELQPPAKTLGQEDRHPLGLW